MSVSLYKHQQTLVERLRDQPRLYAAWACGTGKTIGVLAACADRPMKTLVVGPLTTLYSAWNADAANFPSLRVAVIRGASRAARSRLILDGLWDVAVTNPETFKSHGPDFLAAGVKRFVIDEAAKIKNRESQISKSAAAFADKMESVIALSGYPAPQGYVDWWAQMRAVDKSVLGPDFFRFAYHYGYPEKKKIRRGGVTREVIAAWGQSDRQRDLLAAILTKSVWAMRKEDALDLPAQVDSVRTLDLEAERDIYDAVKKDLVLALHGGGKPDRVRAEACLTKLRQITGGGVYSGGKYQWCGLAKIGALKEIVADEIPGEPVVVWCEFIGEIDRVAAMLREFGRVEILDGRTSADAAGIVARFAGGEAKYLVCHPAAAGHGTNGMQRACSYAVYYSLGFNSDQYVQSRDRIHRSGMGGRPATYIHMVARDTVDESALRSLRLKKRAVEAIMAEVAA
ncbi:MAG: DEAD/DEAH box helicase [Phycisphaerales bacterium]|nr:DEAD/DEAH box helicase [Phycisphaerales bacterium]